MFEYYVKVNTLLKVILVDNVKLILAIAINFCQVTYGSTCTSLPYTFSKMAWKVYGPLIFSLHNNFQQNIMYKGSRTCLKSYFINKINMIG